MNEHLENDIYSMLTDFKKRDVTNLKSFFFGRSIFWCTRVIYNNNVL